MVPLKVAKSSLELHLGTIPGRVGSGRFGWVGSNSDYKAISVQLQLQLPAGTELGNNDPFFNIKSYYTKKYFVCIPNNQIKKNYK